MREKMHLTLAVILCGATGLVALPTGVSAGPMNISSPTSVGVATASVEQVYYRGYNRSYYPRYGGYYRRGYGVPGAAIGAAAGVAGATAGLLGAGVAGATGYGYPDYGYGGGYGGGGSCWQWDGFAGWVRRC